MRLTLCDLCRMMTIFVAKTAFASVMTRLALALLICSTASAQTVEITPTHARARQLDTAAMTVIGREELLRYGDQSVADALRRMPGITVSGVPGRGGEIRMRGLGNG